MKHKGFALVLVLWVLSLLTIMAASFSLSMRRQTVVSAGVKNNAEAQAVAESGIAFAEMMMLNPDATKRWRADGSIYEIESDDAKIRVQMFSEAGKIDINVADETLLKSLVDHAPQSDDNFAVSKHNLASSIIDWRDPDDLVHVDGAEKKEYLDEGLKYHPRNKAFRTVNELQLVLGMNEELFKWMEPFVTVYSKQRQVDLQQASKEVMLLIPGLDAGLIDSYVQSRLDSARSGLPPPPPPFGTGANAPQAQLKVVSVISEAQLDNESSALIKAVVMKAEDAADALPFKILKWQSVTTDEVSLFSEDKSQLLVKQYAGFEFNH